MWTSLAELQSLEQAHTKQEQDQLDWDQFDKRDWAAGKQGQ
jgi:hypothetical protein